MGNVFPFTTFPSGGRCSDYAAIHQYAVHINNEDNTYGFFDIQRDSCLNGWVSGNIVSTTSELADFWFALFEGDLLPPDYLKEMVDFIPLTNGWGRGISYGLGIMSNDFNYFEPNRGSERASGKAVLGHGGDDYGSTSMLNGWIPSINASVTLAMGSAWGMNCSLDAVENYNAEPIAACTMLDVLLQTYSPSFPRLDCRVSNSTTLADLPLGLRCVGLLHSTPSLISGFTSSPLFTMTHR